MDQLEQILEWLSAAERKKANILSMEKLKQSPEDLEVLWEIKRANEAVIENYKAQIKKFQDQKGLK